MVPLGCESPLTGRVGRAVRVAWDAPDQAIHWRKIRDVYGRDVRVQGSGREMATKDGPPLIVDLDGERALQLGQMLVEAVVQ